MGDLAVDTAVEPIGEGSFSATLSPDWAIWGPNGGHLAAIALRAAGAVSTQPRPVSLSCHFLSVGQFAPVRLDVAVLRRARTAESLRVSMWQEETRVLEALVWMDAPVEGLEHDASPAPVVDDPEGLPTVEELLGPDVAWPAFPFWGNVEWRPLDWAGPLSTREAGEPLVRNWYRYRPRARFDDPVLDAARCLILLDTMSWPSARRAHPPGDLGVIAPTVDVNAQFHRGASESEWLLVEGVAPVAEAGLVGFSSRVWSRDRRLLASASGQMRCRPTR